MSDEAYRLPWKDIRRAYPLVRPYRARILLILGCTVLVAGFGVVQPLLYKMAFDGVAGPRATHALLVAVALVFALGLARMAVEAVSNVARWHTQIRVQAELQAALVRRLHTLPISYHRNQAVGGLINRLDRGVSGVIGAFTSLAFELLPSVLYLVLSIVVMLRLDVRLAVLTLVFAPLPALIGVWASREQAEREKTLLERWAAIYARMAEVLAGIVTVRSFAMEEAENRRFLHEVENTNEVVLRGVRRDTLTGGARNLLVHVATTLGLACGGWLVLRHQITLGTWMAFLSYSGGLFGPVQGLTGTFAVVRKGLVSLQVVRDILEAPDEPRDAPDALPVLATAGHVVFENVGFAYGDNPVLTGVSLEAHPGEMIALVGPSGAGKTTMMSLLQRLYDPTEGRILLDGKDLRELEQTSLRSQIGVVLQDALLFSGTIRENIAYGSPGAPEADIRAAARAANAHQFIPDLPGGYDAKVGERGARLSAGQRQRIAIARALLKDPRILILDEATSALDAESEALVQDALARLLYGRTTFVIAHRLSTVIDADRILVLRDGYIREQGTHEQLVHAGGYYARLVHRQGRGLKLFAAA